MPILLTFRYTLQSQRAEAEAQSGSTWDLEAIAHCLQKGDNRVECLEAVDNSCVQDKQKFEALREDPTLDAHLTLWVDCMRELARTFFSLHRTPKMDDAQKRLSALRRKLISEQALSREQMGTFRETHGHQGDCSEQHLHARHKLMTLQRQLRRRTKQSAAALRTSLESELHRALKDGRGHEGHTLTQLLGGQEIGIRTMLFSTAKTGATLECARRTLLYVRFAIVFVGGTAEIGRHRCGRNH